MQLIELRFNLEALVLMANQVLMMLMKTEKMLKLVLNRLNTLPRPNHALLFPRLPDLSLLRRIT
jgi:hypothetical protein